MYLELQSVNMKQKPNGRSVFRWEDNIKIDLKDVCCEDTNWIYLAQDWIRLCLYCEWSNEPLCSMEFWKFLGQQSDRQLLEQGCAPWS